MCSKEGETSGMMDVDSNFEETGIFDMGNSIMYSDISDEESPKSENVEPVGRM